MKITTEDMPERQVGLLIELEEAEIEDHKQRAYRRLVQRYVIPGFRRGKAPRMILERHIGAETLIQDDIEGLLERSVADAVEQQELEPIARPQVTDLESLDPITFRATVALRPEVELGDYESIRVDWEETEVTEEQVEEVLNNLRRQGSPWEPVERAVELGDLLTVDMSGYVDEDPEDTAESEDGDDADTDSEPADEAVPDSDADADDDDESEGEPEVPGRRTFVEETGISYMVQEGVTYPAPGVPEQLVGMNAEETKEFTISVPDDFTIRDLNGKEAHFTVTVREVKEQNLPDLDDEWAQGVEGFGDDVFETVEALRDRIRSDLTERTEAQTRAEFEENILERFAEAATVTYPPIVVDMEVDRILQDQDEQMRGMGMSLAAYAQSTGQGVEQLRDTVRPQAEQRVLRGLLITNLAESTGIEASDEEINEDIAEVVGAQQDEAAQEQARQVFESEAARESVERRIVARKTMDMLVEIARRERDGSEEAAETEAETEADEDSDNRED